jgi:F0F1-type ATP synthase assembly protein I
VVVSQPPDYPGRERFKRAAAAAGSEAYQGAFEAIGSVLIAGAFGYWVDYRWDTTPVGLLVGTAIGFAAMVLRLIRLGKEIHPDSTGAESGSAGFAGSKGSKESKSGEQDADDLTFGESPGMSSVLRDERDERNES